MQLRISKYLSTNVYLYQTMWYINIWNSNWKILYKGAQLYQVSCCAHKSDCYISSGDLFMIVSFWMLQPILIIQIRLLYKDNVLFTCQRLISHTCKRQKSMWLVKHITYVCRLWVLLPFSLFQSRMWGIDDLQVYRGYMYFLLTFCLNCVNLKQLNEHMLDINELWKLSIIYKMLITRRNINKCTQCWQSIYNFECQMFCIQSSQPTSYNSL